MRRDFYNVLLPGSFGRQDTHAWRRGAQNDQGKGYAKRLLPGCRADSLRTGHWYQTGSNGYQERGLDSIAGTSISLWQTAVRYLHTETYSCYLQEFATDMAVCLDSWVGGIRMTHFKLWLVTPDGSHCVINEMDSCVLGQLEEARDSVRFKLSLSFIQDPNNTYVLGQ